MRRCAFRVFSALTLMTGLAAQAPVPGVLWQVTLPGQPRTPPVVSRDGRIVTVVSAYVSSIGDVQQLVVLDPGGERRFARGTVDGFVSMPVVGPNGTIYTVKSGGRVDAIAPDGRVLWSYVVEQVGESDHHVTWEEAAVRSEDGAVFVAGRCVYAFTPSGARMWRTCLGERARAPRCAENSLFVRSGSRLHRLDAHGTPLWSVDVGAGTAAAVFDGRGTAYVASGQNVVAVSVRTGAIAWRTQVPHDVKWVAWSESAQLMVLQERRIDAIDRSGTERWHWNTSDHEVVYGPAAIASNGDVYVGGSAVRRFGAEGPLPGIWRISAEYNMFAPAITADGETLVIADVDKNVQAVRLPVEQGGR